jgi:glycosyltransferase involved in cell wall biosynthesis
MNPETGGVCEAVRVCANGLEDLGVHNEVISVDEELFNKTDKFIQHTLGPAKNAWYYSKNLLPWLTNNITRFDAVIVHGLWLYHGYAVYKTLSSLKISEAKPKLFVMPHGMLDPYFQRARGRRIKAIRNVIYWGLIERKLINTADKILFTCETELILARVPFWPYKPKSETIVGLGVIAPPAYNVNMAQTFKSHLPQLNGSAYLLFLSRIHQKKGVDLLVDAYRKIAEELLGSAHNNHNISLPKLVIAGPGLDSAYGQQVQQMVSASPFLKDRVHFPGMLTGEAKWGAFYGCEAFILPSHQENFGIAVVEALTCRKPVLISNQVNIWRELQEAGGALVADDTNTGTYKMLTDWHNLSLAEKDAMSSKARRCYEQHFEISTVINRFHQILSN